MNKQEIFDKMVTGLFKQGKKSLDENGNCKYHAEDGCKCAVGMLIPDEFYNPIIDSENNNSGMCVEDVVVTLSDVGDYLVPSDMTVGESIEFLEDCQIVHDGESVEMWKSGFEAIAEKYNLTMPDVETISTNQ